MKKHTRGYRHSNTCNCNFCSGKGRRLFQKGNKFRNGFIPWNKDKKNVYSEDTINRISTTLLEGHKEGRIKSWNKDKTSKEDNRILSGKNHPLYGKKGVHNSPETEFKKGNISYDMTDEIRKKISIGNLGKPKSEEHIRKMIETRRRLFEEGILKPPSGDKHYNWQGGKSFEPYMPDFNKQFKELIRQRDNLSCLKCNLFQDDSLKLYKRKLIIHHINYDKKLSIPQNCCALCVRCNCEVNFNRIHWTKFFQSLLSEKYSYQYSENNKIILEVKQ